MKWIAIAGSWRKTNKKIEADVRKAARKIIKKGDGIISGGALGVDYFALDEVIKIDLCCKKRYSKLLKSSIPGHAWFTLDRSGKYKEIIIKNDYFKSKNRDNNYLND